MEEKERSSLKRILVNIGVVFLGVLILGIAKICVAFFDLFWKFRMVRERKPIEKKISPALQEEMKTGPSYIVKIAVEVTSCSKGWSNRYFRASKCWKEFFLSYYQGMTAAEICGKGREAKAYNMFENVVFASVFLRDIQDIAAHWYVEKVKLSKEWRR